MKNIDAVAEEPIYMLITKDSWLNTNNIAEEDLEKVGSGKQCVEYTIISKSEYEIITRNIAKQNMMQRQGVSICNRCACKDCPKSVNKKIESFPFIKHGYQIAKQIILENGQIRWKPEKIAVFECEKYFMETKKRHN